MNLQNKMIAEFMGFPIPAIGQKWNYGRQVCHSTNTRDLIIKDINEYGVAFDQEMAYKNYGLDYFDGVVFYPQMKADNIHNPSIRYDLNMDYLMAVVGRVNKKSETIGYVDGLELFDLKIISTTVRQLYPAVLEYINWYNDNIKT